RELVRRRLEVIQVGAVPVQPQGLDAPGQPALQRGALVARQVDAALPVDVLQQAVALGGVLDHSVTSRSKPVSQAAISASGSTASTAPARIADAGMAKCSALLTSCATTWPPPRRMARAPSVPSLPPPDSTTPTAPSPNASAADWNNTSTEGRLKRTRCRRVSRTRRSASTVRW